MTVSKYKAKHSKKSFQTHFPHFLDVCLSTLLVFSLAIQGIQAAKLRLLFASHTDLWWCLSHWVSLLHRSWFQDQSSAKKAKEILMKLPTYPLGYERLFLRQPWCDTSQWNLSISATQNACRYWRQWHTSKFTIYSKRRQTIIRQELGQGIMIVSAKWHDWLIISWQRKKEIWYHKELS